MIKVARLHMKDGSDFYCEVNTLLRADQLEDVAEVEIAEVPVEDYLNIPATSSSRAFFNRSST